MKKICILFITLSSIFYNCSGLNSSNTKNRHPNSKNIDKRPEPLVVNCPENNSDPVDFYNSNLSTQKELKLYQEIKCKNEDDFFQQSANKINEIQQKRSKNNHGIKRGFHAKGHACVKGELTVFSPDIITEEYVYDLGQKTVRSRRPINMAWNYKGLSSDIDYAFSGPVFGKPQTLPILIRYSNGDPSVQDDNSSDFRGFAFKVYNSDSSYEKMSEPMDIETQDFLMLSNPRMVAGSANAFMKFVDATSGSDLSTYKYAGKEIVKHSKVGTFLTQFFLPNTPANYPKLTERRFWSGSAVGWGGRAARYLVFPCDDTRESESNYFDLVNRNRPEVSKRDYYRKSLYKEKDSNNRICYDFFVQFQKDVKQHSIEDSSKVWSEDRYSKKPGIISTPIHIGKVVSDLNSMDTSEEVDCAQKNFSPWNGYEFHRPLGSINRIRKAVYKASQTLRKDKEQLFTH
jgi:hypothetical protein